jgi:hypothetical protein
METDCRRTTNHLIDIVEDHIPEFQKKDILDHIGACPRCARLVEDFARLWQDTAAAGKHKPSERFWPELAAKIEALEKPQPFRKKIIAGLRLSLRPAAAVVILAFGIYAGYQLGNMPPAGTVPTEMSYFEPYTQDLLDFPEGSLSDFYTQYEIQNQQKTP